ncbi:MAG TPA: large-conductance mechanosensitive channel protein MscL [Candidatus Moranbacteria bacterium]|nr:large-conductance mechanosensitive channel protein MscL [Candidatus Moranbacteria bacterium]
MKERTKKTKKQNFLVEFKEFAMKGNVIDLAVGIVIGGAFGKIVSSFVEDVLMPPLGILLGGVNFTTLSLKVGEASFNYGAFIQTVVDFVIIAFAIFLLIKAINKLKRNNEEAEAKAKKIEKEEVKLLREIRDLLKK